jgi:hypothetical protein
MAISIDFKAEKMEASKFKMAVQFKMAAATRTLLFNSERVQIPNFVG